MNPNKIYCLMNCGRALEEEDRNILFHTARRLFHTGRKKQAVKSDTMEGIVSTRHEYTMLGTTAGMKFFATLATNDGQNKVEFIVRPGHLEPNELDQSEWGFMPPEFFRKLTEIGPIGLN